MQDSIQTSNFKLTIEELKNQKVSRDKIIIVVLTDNITLRMDFLISTMWISEAYLENELDKADWNDDMVAARWLNDLKRMKNYQKVGPFIQDVWSAIHIYPSNDSEGTSCEQNTNQDSESWIRMRTCWLMGQESTWHSSPF